MYTYVHTPLRKFRNVFKIGFGRIFFLKEFKIEITAEMSFDSRVTYEF